MFVRFISGSHLREEVFQEPVIHETEYLRGEIQLNVLFEVEQSLHHCLLAIGLQKSTILAHLLVLTALLCLFLKRWIRQLCTNTTILAVRRRNDNLLLKTYLIITFLLFNDQVASTLKSSRTFFYTLHRSKQVGAVSDSCELGSLSFTQLVFS